MLTKNNKSKNNTNLDLWGNNWISSINKLYSKVNENLPEIPIGLHPRKFTINNNTITAIFNISDNEEYVTTLKIEPLNETQKDLLAKEISSRLITRLQTDIGIISDDLYLICKDLSIFPDDISDISHTCNCKENDLCPHIMALHSYLADKIDDNPLEFFNLFGINIEELIDSNFFPQETPIISSSTTYESITEDKTVDKLNEINFETVNIEEAFAIMPEHPLFYNKKDFKLKFQEIYETVSNEIEKIFTFSNLAPIRDTEFHMVYNGKNFEFLVTPPNHYIYYLKSMGSRANTRTEFENIPEFDKDNQKTIYKQKEVIKSTVEQVLDYFLHTTIKNSEDFSSNSAKFLYNCAYVALQLVRTNNYIPEIIFEDNAQFRVRYIPLAEDQKIKNTIDILKSSIPSYIYFDEKNNLIASEKTAYDILCLFITHIIHKLTFLKSSKIKASDILGVFTKHRSFNELTTKGKNVAKSFSLWLECLAIKNKNIMPVIKVEQSSSNSSTFLLHLYLTDTSKAFNDLIPISELFSEANTFSKVDIAKHIYIASAYLPVLTDILNSKGEYTPELDYQGLIELLTSTSLYLNKLGINVIIPKNINNASSIRLVLKAKSRKNSIDFNNIFSEENSSTISFDDLLDFSYEVAIGDTTVSKEEFLKLVQSADGIVKLKDQYVLLRPEDMDLLIKKLNKPLPEFKTSKELLHTLISESFDDYEFNPDESIQRILDDCTKIEDIEIPNDLKGTLRGYQVRGYKWLYSNANKKLGSCLADDMGLGKTVQVISYILKLKEENKLDKPILVVCPTTLVGNWQKECEKFGPSLNVSIFHGTERNLDTNHLDNVDIIITTYGILRIETERFKEFEWKIVVIDEAQNIKNPDTAQTLAVKSLNAENYIALTGTPVENRLSELWSIFDFVNSGYLGDINDFQKRYATPIEKFKDKSKVEKLKLATSPFIMRRLKTDKTIIKDLPEKNVIDEYCYLTKEQAALYEKMLQNTMKTIEGASGINRRGHIFKLITALKQICNHPAQYDKSGKFNRELSGKTDKVLSLLESILDNNEKALIFTQYKEMGDILQTIIQNELQENSLFFHGSLTRISRDKLVEEFQTNEDIRLMIISLKAGGTGLNLTAASNVIHYDLWWNPAVEDQATDRAYRIGQTQNVNVHRLITLGTFEEKIDEMIKSKKELADLTISTGEKWITEMSNHDLMKMFSLSKY
ncbi:MAG: SNF2-related protein [Bacteroidota bacterium]|nr:SNF2-related protein [Bacteroidota bacterium]